MLRSLTVTATLTLVTAFLQLPGMVAAFVPLNAAAPADVPPCTSSWSAIPNTHGFRNPRAIVAVSGEDAWIVGSREDMGADEEATKVEVSAAHWNGNQWSLVPTPNVKGAKQSSVSGAAADSPTSIWAVGYSLVSGSYRTLVMRWDGTDWNIVPSPSFSDVQSSLTAVDALASDKAWAVGYTREATHRKTLILRWDGVSWAEVPSPNPSSLSNTLLDVATIDENNVWAVGYKSTSHGLRSLVLRFDGTIWQEVTFPTEGDGDNVLTAISASSGDDVWAVGYYSEGVEQRALAMHFDGTTWQVVPTASHGDGLTILRAIEALTPTKAWSVGFEFQADAQAFVATTQHWNGSIWSYVPTGTAEQDTASELLAVAGIPGTSEVWAAGRQTEPDLGGLGILCSFEQGGAASQQPVRSPEGIGFLQAPTGPSSIAIESSISTTPQSRVDTAEPVMAVDMAVTAGISEFTRTYGAVVADFDNNGAPDIFLGRHLDAPRLYINDNNGHFTETNEGNFVGKDRHECAAADVNQDGLMDIFCSFGAMVGTATKLERLYIQQPDHTFVDQAAQYGLFEPFARGRSANFIDANGDDLPDLFSINEPDRADGLPSMSRLFINQGGAAFLPASEYGLDFEANSVEAEVEDLNEDGWQDLLVTMQPGRRSPLHLYRNEQGKGFTEVTQSVGLGQSVSDAVVADVNGDEWQDVIELTPDDLRVFINSKGTFSLVFSAPLEFGKQVVAGDVNGDERLDLYILRAKGNGIDNMPDVVYVNDGTGQSFSQLQSIPTTTEGQADSVYPIDYDSNGLTDFLVLNGKVSASSAPGPVQLIAFFPDLTG